jgi:hypothetical protein
MHRTTLRYPKTHQNTDRIARTLNKVRISRTFLRSIHAVAYRLWVDYYRPQIDRQLSSYLRGFHHPSNSRGRSMFSGLPGIRG